MTLERYSEWSRRLFFVVALLASPLMAVVLVAGALTADAGPAGWFLLVVVPLGLLGTGLYLMADEELDWSPRAGRRT
ncbi:hypothetical protein DMJ13_11685 [halophilic archaeon]|nr:hypothetical protein DMJ13_11685 [halophilic archaeon]